MEFQLIFGFREKVFENSDCVAAQKIVAERSGFDDSNNEKMADKPVSRILCGAQIFRLCIAAIIPLGPDSHLDSSSLPEGLDELGQLSPPIWPCTTRGFPCLPIAGSGGLLPHLFTLTRRLPAAAPCARCRPSAGFPSDATEALAPAVYFLWHFP